MKRIIAAGLALLLFAGVATAGLTLTDKKLYVGLGGFKVATCRVKYDASYATGGESLTAAMLGMTDVLWCVAAPDTVIAAGYEFFYDDANAVLECLTVSVSTNPASADFIMTSDDTSPDTVSVDIAATAGTLTRAEASGSLATIKARVVAFGY